MLLSHTRRRRHRKVKSLAQGAVLRLAIGPQSPRFLGGGGARRPLNVSSRRGQARRRWG